MRIHHIFFIAFILISWSNTPIRRGNDKNLQFRHGKVEQLCQQLAAFFNRRKSPTGDILFARWIIDCERLRQRLIVFVRETARICHYYYYTSSFATVGGTIALTPLDGGSNATSVPSILYWRNSFAE